MNKIKDGGPAFPTLGQDIETEGLSLRDYFAAKTLPMVARQFYSTGTVLTDGNVPDLCSKVAYEFADAMLRAREAS